MASRNYVYEVSGSVADKMNQLRTILLQNEEDVIANKLVEEFGDIKTITAYMTMGQLTKYTEKDGCLYDRDGKIVYNEETQECFE